ncbi:hypothetical protein ACFX1W_026113 [Malus domestica]
MNASLLGLVSVEKVKTTTMQMRGLKAQGPDGFPEIFYQAHWDVIAAYVNEIIREMMHMYENPRKIKATHLVLILEVQNQESISSYVPLVCVTTHIRCYPRYWLTVLSRFYWT